MVDPVYVDRSYMEISVFRVISRGFGTLPLVSVCVRMMMFGCGMGRVVCVRVGCLGGIVLSVQRSSIGIRLVGSVCVRFLLSLRGGVVCVRSCISCFRVNVRSVMMVLILLMGSVNSVIVISLILLC